MTIWKEVLFMRNGDSRRSGGGAKSVLTLIMGALLALGIELLLLLLGAVTVSAGILRVDTGMQVTAAACLLGCFIGGSFACRDWKSHRLLAGLLTGICCFVLIFLGALTGRGFKFGTQALIELASCVIGGGLAGLLAGRKKPKKRKAR